ncbi:putative glutamine amidotransferase-like class 1 domain-containing protein 3B, mitochondrial [Neodiprion fabricii]|uniref:putative glutamine amidotransferase-like class 1 domain-containing protein 3B, mitochondrial n=1 Tax=Neodiprion fabricii TaxID=2872261 RepID=UPI001ED94728|nr:putative glutamine amidotransferase-like class 1 domain-containing protein 3B, mitochondrial [Neodiprion fabricii]
MFRSRLSSVLLSNVRAKLSNVSNLHVSIFKKFRAKDCEPKPVAVVAEIVALVSASGSNEISPNGREQLTAAPTIEKELKHPSNRLLLAPQVLCGCGSLDGSEVTEAVSLAINLNLNGFKPEFFAPNTEICGVMDHLCKQPDSSGVARNALVEAARIARSEVRPLCECDCNSGIALILPGGFGCAKTLSDFATKGAECTVLPDLERVITEFALSKKPIGAICIAPVLVAKVLCGTKITLGKSSPPEKWPHCAAIAEVKKMGAKHEERSVTQVTHCKQHNVFSTPAWMYNGTFAEVHDGIGRLVKALKKKLK